MSGRGVLLCVSACGTGLGRLQPVPAQSPTNNSRDDLALTGLRHIGKKTADRTVRSSLAGGFIYMVVERHISDKKTEHRVKRGIDWAEHVYIG